MPGEFLPKTLNDWLVLVLTVSGIISGGWALAIKTIRGPLLAQIRELRDHGDEKLKGQGARIGSTEAACERSAAKIESNDRQIERLEFQGNITAERFGRLEAKFDDLTKTLGGQRDQLSVENRLVVERLARIETKLEIMDELKGALIAIASK